MSEETIATAARLAEINLGLGARDGYSGADLTNVRSALAQHEVPYLPAAADAEQVLEFRIHGVGGAPASVNLETPETVQVAGDQQAGCYRARFPGGTATGRPRVEAYCWGRLDYSASWSALWLLLLPFGLVNVAHWALPDASNAFLARASRATLRLLALTLTAAFIGVAAYLFADLLAWQAAGIGKLWSWTGWFTHRTLGTRLALAMAAVLLAICGLWWLSLRTQGQYESKQSGHGAPDDPKWALSSRTLWCGERPLVRQRSAHLTVAGATVLFIEMLPHSSLPWLRYALLGVAGLLAVAAAVAVLSTWTDRVERAGVQPGSLDELARRIAWASLALAAVMALVRIWWRPKRDDAAIPYDPELQVILLFVCLGLLLLAAVFVVLQRPWGTKAAPRDVMGKGLASVAIAALATLVSGIFGGTLLMTVANILAKPTFTKPSIAHGKVGSNVLTVPSSVYAAGLAFATALVSAGVVGIVLVVRRHRIAQELRTGTGPGSVASVYADRSAESAGTASKSRTAVAGKWATARLTDDAVAALFGVAVPTGIVLLAYAVALLSDHTTQLLTTIATYGTSAGVLATGAFLLYLRSALTDVTKRKRFGFFWDVVTFWPRACHPLGPPSYAERSIPEVVTRLRRLVGDTAGDASDPAVAQQVAEAIDETVPPVYREKHSPVLLVGYSQGSPISTAVVAQLPAQVRDGLALLTLASPARRLYGRAFPAYFGSEQLDYLKARLTGDNGVRWRNLVRRSDYIGGWALAEPAADAAVDREIYDPPVLWTDPNPSPPQIHMHSSWFADPQTRPYATTLAAMLVPPPADG